MSGSAPRCPLRRQPCLGLPGGCSLFVPALVLGAWTAAGAAQGGGGEGEMTPFLLAIAAILVAAKIERAEKAISDLDPDSTGPLLTHATGEWAE